MRATGIAREKVEPHRCVIGQKDRQRLLEAIRGMGPLALEARKGGPVKVTYDELVEWISLVRAVYEGRP